jgi:hypothetical protein
MYKWTAVPLPRLRTRPIKKLIAYKGALFQADCGYPDIKQKKVQRLPQY